MPQFPNNNNNNQLSNRIRKKSQVSTKKKTSKIIILTLNSIKSYSEFMDEIELNPTTIQGKKFVEQFLSFSHKIPVQKKAILLNAIKLLNNSNEEVAGYFDKLQFKKNRMLHKFRKDPFAIFGVRDQLLKSPVIDKKYRDYLLKL